MQETDDLPLLVAAELEFPPAHADDPELGIDLNRRPFAWLDHIMNRRVNHGRVDRERPCARSRTIFE
jgi:hypothetical protein